MTGGEPTIQIAVPDGWSTVDDGAGVRRSALPGAGPGSPSVAVAVVSRGGNSAEADLLQGLAELGAVLSDGVVIDVESTPEGSSILVAHEVGGVDVTTLQRRFVGPGHHTAVVAATVADGLWSAWEAPLRRVLDSVEVDW